MRTDLCKLNATDTGLSQIKKCRVAKFIKKNERAIKITGGIGLVTVGGVNLTRLAVSKNVRQATVVGGSNVFLAVLGNALALAIGAVLIVDSI